MLPFDFIEQMRPLLGAELDAFLHALQTERETSVRLNNKVDFQQLKLLREAGLEEVPWCPEGYYVKQRPQFTLEHAARLIHVQTAALTLTDKDAL